MRRHSFARAVLAAIVSAAVFVGAVVAATLSRAELDDVVRTQQAVPTIDVTPIGAASGSPVTVSGIGGCSGGPPSVTLERGGNRPSVPIAAEMSMPKDPVGPWSVTVVIPPTAAAGEYALRVRCGVTSFLPVGFTVLPGEFATLQVSPDVIQVGAGAVTLSASGNACRQATDAGAGVSVRVDEVIGPDPTLRIVGSAVAVTDTSGRWSAEFTIPTDQPTWFFVRATCRTVDGAKSLWEYPGTYVRVLAGSDGSTFTG